MFNQLLKNESTRTTTENGGIAYTTTDSFCLDLFFKAGGMRYCSEEDISAAVIRAFAEDETKTMKIIFFARDITDGLGERRFFRTAVKALAGYAPEAVRRNIHNFAEYGRYDDLCALLGTACEGDAVSEIKSQLDTDIRTLAVSADSGVSLLAKWLPSVNASSKQTRNLGRRMAELLGMSEPEYRRTLVALRKRIDLIENRIRVRDYTFDYEVQPSGAMLKYRRAFHRNDGERYTAFLEKVNSGKANLNTSTLYPYDVVRKCLESRHGQITDSERLSLDVTWKNLTDTVRDKHENALAVIDGSGSMYGGGYGLRPADAALSLGIYFAEHSKGEFANHFITFSNRPQLVEIKGDDIVQKVQYCAGFNEIANTDLEAVFRLILTTALKNKVKQKDMPSKLYIISDMQFDYCIDGGNSMPMFETMKKRYEMYGYKLPQVVFWNVASRSDVLPVKISETGAALVSGYSANVFSMVMKGELDPAAIMDQVISSPRYAAVS